MTEDEAKTKWCPHVRKGIDEHYGTDNRWNNWVPGTEVVKSPDGYESIPMIDTGKLDPGCCCIASKCMAWRELRSGWRNAPNKADGVIGENTGSTVIGGYCGLAGKS